MNVMNTQHNFLLLRFALLLVTDLVDSIRGLTGDASLDHCRLVRAFLMFEHDASLAAQPAKAEFQDCGVITFVFQIEEGSCVEREGASLMVL